VTAALRGGAARLRPVFRHIDPKTRVRLRAKRHPGLSRSARGVAGAGLAIFEPDMSGYWADNPFGSLGFDGNSGPGGILGAGSGAFISAGSRISAEIARMADGLAPADESRAGPEADPGADRGRLG
jgi:hypothetical protein